MASPPAKVSSPPPDKSAADEQLADEQLAAKHADGARQAYQRGELAAAVDECRQGLGALGRHVPTK